MPPQCGGVGRMYRLFERSEAAPKGAAVFTATQCYGAAVLRRRFEVGEARAGAPDMAVDVAPYE